jgi:hypothetical protein
MAPLYFLGNRDLLNTESLPLPMAWPVVYYAQTAWGCFPGDGKSRKVLTWVFTAVKKGCFAGQVGVGFGPRSPNPSFPGPPWPPRRAAKERVCVL